MIVIPMGTDAPIYHWPYATVAMILINIALLIAIPPISSPVTLDENDEVIEQVSITNFERYALTLGNGIHPVQWVTHNFLHQGLIHLLGNLLFLWAFGIVVEGKLGALKFLATYLAIGTLHGAFLQLILLKSGMNGNAVGASAVIYGLMSICMIWAPRNELTCTIILPIGFRILVFHREFYYTTVALFYFGGQFVSLAFWGGLAGRFMLSEMGHLSGALWGSVIALFLLKLHLVDCEGWDVFTLLARHRQLGRDWKSRGERLDRQKESLRSSLRAGMKARSRLEQPSVEPGLDLEARASSAVKRVMKAIESGNLDVALLAYDRSRQALPYWPSQADLLAMIKAFQAQGPATDSIPLMRDHCSRFPAVSDKMRLKLAQVLIRDRQRPMAALKVLGEIPSGSLPPELESARLKLVSQADRMCEEGVLELEGDD
ncbi:rhomboid family intramembrane serine protease [Tundrisphaera lichenicola]|uniref:rhomboid family intramembrane serine protease n=1 Tax=Tundrisphaera lichenicola TaxID=2029860 RepID=UPI003EBD8B7E